MGSGISLFLNKAKNKNCFVFIKIASNKHIWTFYHHQRTFQFSSDYLILQVCHPIFGKCKTNNNYVSFFKLLNIEIIENIKKIESRIQDRKSKI